MNRTTRATTLMNVVATAALAGVLLLPAPRSVVAQDALGGGNVLDNSLSTEGNINPRAAQEDYRVRNLLVTDNVPGGRGFRESVGYTAAGDFRGTLGSDDFYQFRSQSAFSAPAFINYGRTYEQLRFGSGLASLEFSRDFQGSTLRDLQTPSQPVPGELIDARMRLDRISRSSQSLGVYESAPASEVVGVMYDKDGRAQVARASSLTGISLTPVDGDGQQIGLTLYDMARIREQGAADAAGESVVGKQFEPAFDAAFDPFQRNAAERPKPETQITGERVDGRIGTDMQGERIDSRENVDRVNPGQQSSYRDVLKRVVERYADRDDVSLNIDPSLLKEFQQEYDDLRKELRGINVDQQITRTVPQFGTEEETDEPEPIDPDAMPPGTSGISDPLTAPVLPDGSDLSNIDQLAGALRHGQQIAKLTAGEQTRFNELVAQAEQSLRQGEFFLAERRFDRALRFNPGNPLATAGMGHAQIGSGLYLSAALTLRTLLTNNPEMIDVQYDTGLVPARGRLESAITSLRERIGKQQDVAMNSFLLAYIGRLLGDRTIMTEGLDHFAKASPSDPLEKLLRAIWLATDEPQK